LVILCLTLVVATLIVLRGGDVVATDLRWIAKFVMHVSMFERAKTVHHPDPEISARLPNMTGLEIN